MLSAVIICSIDIQTIYKNKPQSSCDVTHPSRREESDLADGPEVLQCLASSFLFSTVTKIIHQLILWYSVDPPFIGI